ncbi:multiheme c-type cytochrome [Prosthecobacter sp.]|uniref:multiheme c-type cytochrome n=1 Tax=Prosthecobacter sp. TaxID=1965333 RepID=UPI0025D700AB|nr:multiheme c-type cytochrome [Prosthecobacter sp.]
MTNEFRETKAKRHLGFVIHSSFVIRISSLALLLASCDKPAALPQQRPVRVHLTCDVNGRIEPCGCFTGQFGGLSRTQTVLMAEGKPTLRVDAGDSIGGAEDYHVIQFKHVLQAFKSLGFHAVNLGRREAALDVETLRKVAADSPVPLVSANVVDARTQEPMARPWVQATVDGVRYGIVGVVDPKSVGETDLGAGVELLDPASAITKHLPEAKKDVDVLVLLTFAREERMKELAAQFFEFQLILGGDVRQPSQELLRANRSYILATTNQSRALGFFQAALKPDGTLEQPKQEIIFMADDIPQDEGIIAHAEAYRAEVRTTKLAIDDPQRTRDDAVPGVRVAARYVGSEACAACHAEDYAIWQKSAHSMAFPALQRRESEADPSCIGCHTIGFGTESGYRREFAGKRLTQVGCESCHGPGSTHVEQRNAQRTQGREPGFKFRPLAAADCVTCHHGEFSRPFEWEEFWKLIAHGKKK